MNVTQPPLPADAARLLRRVYRFRSRNRARQALGIPFLFRRRRKAALVAQLRAHWTGGYVEDDAGNLVYLPANLDFQALKILFGGAGAHRAALGFLPPGGIAIDVGANLGEWTLPLAQRAGPTGRVLAIEPNPEIAVALALTLGINNLPQAGVIEAALSDRDGTAALERDAANSGATRLGTAGLAVATRRLDGLVSDHALNRLDLVKIDVEGHERQVLDGAASSLHSFHPALVIESGHEGPGDRAAIAGLLDELGYALAAVLHEHGALPADLADYRAAQGSCAAREAHDLLWLPKRSTAA